MNIFKIFVILFWISSCNSETAFNSDITDEMNLDTMNLKTVFDCNNSNFRKSWITQQDGNNMLYGGKEEYMNFDISNLTIDPCGFKYGLGREAFHALISPQFITVAVADKLYNEGSRFLVAASGGEARAYSVNLLIQHEIVNDVIDGKPIMAAYCILADLGAIYTRSYCNHVFTFGLSGYTYSDENVWGGVNGFVLWDRDTESLWWPLIDKAVSGPMQGTSLKKFDGKWLDTTWGEVKKHYPNATVLKSGQTMKAPTSWTGFEGC